MTKAPVRRRTPSEQVSAALLNAAETVLDREGAGGVTVRAVAAEAAVAPMSVYNRFDNKDGLLAALAMRGLDELADLIDVPVELDAVPRFRAACLAYRQFALEHPARYMLIFTAGSPLSDQTSAPAVRGRAVFDVLVALVADVMGSAEEGAITESAQAVWSTIHGAVTIEQIGIGQTPDPDTTFSHTLDLLIAGLRA
ncbi:TetR-like C-terminal domain-containing protein [Mycobacterium sp. 236(2023)]|uniref:TetR/AcrR family transcriptional regulator n=1 Tax=Mycobacterium sp. 236(2023) TaxID=3038163 RepID=UPI0024151610|nr:TetR-like C-terminal domain-containing protein [Mycobacterium sp. 236(2023)]MDG4667116.1 TetR-like C-terminal domain-containing protein [Mycobacterium sp. 236(2023)]